MRLSLWVLILAVASGCAYPRRETFTYPAPANAESRSAGEPSGMYSIRLVDAELAPFKGAGLPWDPDGSQPDPYVKLILGDRVVWESPPQDNTLHPEWNVTLPRNVYISASTRFRVEMWDKDSASSDPAGAFQRVGLPENALPNASARLSLDNLGAVTIVLGAPIASRGVGLRFEIHGDGLLVLDVEPFSPAARAGVKAGDMITAIGGTPIDGMGDNKAASELSLAGDRGAALTLLSGKQRHDVQLDRDPLWLTM